MVTIFIVEDDPMYGTIIKRTLEADASHSVHLFRDGKSCLDHLYLSPDLVSIDYQLPDSNGIDLLKAVKAHDQEINAVILSAQKEVEVVVEAFKQGADGYIVKNRSGILELEKRIENLHKRIKLKEEVERLREQLIDRRKYRLLQGQSPAMLKILGMMQRVESKNIMVLVTGETGTGKEMVARTLHDNSSRSRKALVTINMAAIPEDLIESELFGHEKGAFTGAGSRRIGKFEEAQGGTIFLDEIGDMPLPLQSRMLRVLQEKEITRLGSNKTIKLDIRVIAATNTNLQDEVDAGRFRSDLFYRLQGFWIHLPPLSAREGDVLLLARTFIQSFCQDNSMPEMRMRPEAAHQLEKHNWPGNVRELKSVIERACLLADGMEITLADLVFPHSMVR